MSSLSAASGDGSSVCRTTNSESSYSSIFGRWWPLARVLDGERMEIELQRPSRRSLPVVGSNSATQTKHSGRVT